MDEQAIPSFKNPPVIEVVWSVQFAELSWLGSPDTGVFWSSIKNRYPRCEEAPPIGHITEGEHVFSSPPEGPRMIIGPAPLNRQWFVSESDTELIQLQRDRLCYNWRQRGAADVYPRYPHMKAKFEESWEAFLAFVKDTGHESPTVDQCEMTYINYLPCDLALSSPGDVAKIVPFFAWPKGTKFLPVPRSLGCKLVFDLNGPQGRLHASLKHGRRMDESESELFILDLTARGLPSATDASGLRQWFGEAREWIVRGFADLTSAEMHELWGREQ